jgi:hypothetical protein
MERISTNYNLDGEEVEGLVRHLRESGFFVNANGREYSIYQGFGKSPNIIYQSLGFIRDNSLIISYQAERLLENVEQYRTQVRKGERR